MCYLTANSKAERGQAALNYIERRAAAPLLYFSAVLASGVRQGPMEWWVLEGILVANRRLQARRRSRIAGGVE